MIGQINPETKNETAINKSYSQMYRWILSYLSSYRITFTLTVLLGIIIAIIELLLPKSLQIFIDKVLPVRNPHFIIYAIFSLVILVFVSILLSYKKIPWKEACKSILQEIFSTVSIKK